ncbi:hypothetical protein HN935_00280 [archaeon]|jgi:hypothetical protein|nr:hypothetical protein [archaeon]
MVKKVVKKTVTETINDDGSRKTVVKEHAPKEVVKKKPAVKKKKMTAREREELLIENFVGLQHAMTNMSIKFGSLSDNISKLLQVFEESAKNFVSGGKSDDRDMLKKIDSLLNQNKTIAKGLVLMEGKLRGRSEEPKAIPPRVEMKPRTEAPQMRPRPLPSA